MQKGISIALAVYEGGAFLEEQLCSLLEQTLCPDEIVITDDSYTCDSEKIINSISKESKINIKYIKNKISLGVVANFEKAISLCCKQYIMLCDQDDVWVQNKVKLFYKKMLYLEEEHRNVPLLIFSDLRTVDRNLSLINESFLKECGVNQKSMSFETLILQNMVTGCATMFNRKLLEIALPFPKNITMHDHWLALLAFGGGHYYFINKPTTLYRQHKNNAVGTKNNSLLQKIKKSMKIKKESLRLQFKFNQLQLVLRRLKNRGYPCEKYDIKQTYNILNKAGFKAISFCIIKKIKGIGFFNNYYFYIQLLLLKYMKGNKKKS